MVGFDSCLGESPRRDGRGARPRRWARAGAVRRRSRWRRTAPSGPSRGAASRTAPSSTTGWSWTSCSTSRGRSSPSTSRSVTWRGPLPFVWAAPGGGAGSSWPASASPSTASTRSHGAAAPRALRPPPDNARLEKHAVYRFQARWAEEWRPRPRALAGDAAHQTPPFVGQGLCAGMRDAANVVWKPDLGSPGARTRRVSTPMDERDRTLSGPSSSSPSRWAICSASPTRQRRPGARRGAYPGLRRHRHRRAPPFPAVHPMASCSPARRMGDLFVQGEVEQQGRRARFDDAFGAGWQLVTLGAAGFRRRAPAWFAGIGGSVVPFGCTVPGSATLTARTARFASTGSLLPFNGPTSRRSARPRTGAAIAHLARSLATRSSPPEIDLRGKVGVWPVHDKDGPS